MRDITHEQAIKILNDAIERCKKILSELDENTEDYSNIYAEMRMYQKHKETLLKGGVTDE